MRLRVIGAIMGVTLLVLLCLLIPLANFLTSATYSATFSELEKNAFILGSRTSAVLWQPSAENTAEATTIATAYSTASGARVIVTNAQGIALVTTDAGDSTVGSSFASRPEIAEALNGVVSSGERYSNSLKTDLLYVAVPIFSGQNVIGTVRLTFPDAEVDRRVVAQVSLLWAVGASALVLAAIVGLVLAGTVTAPLGRLTRTAGMIADGDLGKRSGVRRGATEIRQLSEAFDRMADQLELLLDEQRRFAADASHQLRTPLTALRLRLESARSLIDSEPDRAQSRLEAAEAEAERLNELVEALLLLSRGELGLGSRVSVDVSSAVNAVVETWRPLAEESGIAISTTVTSGLTAFALEQAVENVVGNLIDNAIAACQPGGAVTVAAEATEEWVTIVVSDTGIGLTAEECEQAFTRFWRGDTSRTGTGIGLTIVHRLVTASGGQVALEPNLPNGVRATARFPRFDGVSDTERG